MDTIEHALRFATIRLKWKTGLSLLVAPICRPVCFDLRIDQSKLISETRVARMPLVRDPNYVAGLRRDFLLLTDVNEL